MAVCGSPAVQKKKKLQIYNKTKGRHEQQSECTLTVGVSHEMGRRKVTVCPGWMASSASKPAVRDAQDRNTPSAAPNMYPFSFSRAGSDPIEAPSRRGNSPSRAIHPTLLAVKNLIVVRKRTREGGTDQFSSDVAWRVAVCGSSRKRPASGKKKTPAGTVKSSRWIWIFGSYACRPCFFLTVKFGKM